MDPSGEVNIVDKEVHLFNLSEFNSNNLEVFLEYIKESLDVKTVVLKK